MAAQRAAPGVCAGVALALLAAFTLAASCAAAAVTYGAEAEADRVTSLPGVKALPTPLFSG